jgi:hypothetical protein
MLSIKICSIRFLRCDTILSTFSPFVFVCILSLFLFFLTFTFHSSYLYLFLLFSFSSSLPPFLFPSYILLFVFLFFSLPSSLSIFFLSLYPVQFVSFYFLLSFCQFFLTLFIFLLVILNKIPLLHPHYHFHKSIFCA